MVVCALVAAGLLVAGISTIPAVETGSAAPIVLLAYFAAAASFGAVAWLVGFPGRQ
jgi:hypothetical protein